jgi:hypothetical protein
MYDQVTVVAVVTVPVRMQQRILHFPSDGQQSAKSRPVAFPPRGTLLTKEPYAEEPPVRFGRRGNGV